MTTAKTKGAPKKKKEKVKVSLARGKRKESVAKARIRKGKGQVRVNKHSLNALTNRWVREIISEPLRFVPEVAQEIDVEVNVQGGGIMGQAEACRTAIARALVEYTGDAALKEKFKEESRFILSEDSRRVEPKKFGGRKARARFQKSYR